MESRFDKALHFAIEAHKNVYRKSSNIPFIIHPMEVAVIASTITEDEDVLIACLLHDTVEDAGITLTQIRELFGERVMSLVAAESENKRREMLPEDSWTIRKEESLEELKNANDRNVKILWLADKLANMRSFYRLYLSKGDDMWLNFHQRDPKKQEWYYRSIAKYTSELKENLAYQEYVDLINKVFEGE